MCSQGQDASSDYLNDDSGNYFMVTGDRAAGSSGWNIFLFVKVRPLTSTAVTPSPSQTPAP